MSSPVSAPFEVDANIAHRITHRLPVDELVDPQLLVPNLTAQTKIGAIKELVDLLHGRGVVRDSLSFLQSVLERENLQSTILSHSVAMPHARSRTVNQLGMALGIAHRPIDFPSGDERRAIHLICLIAVPADAAGSYLALLSTLAGALRDENFRDSLLHATSTEEIHQLLLSRTAN